MTLIELGAKQADMFSENHIAYCEVLVTYNASRLILNYVYSNLCRVGKIVPIEGLDIEQKHNLWSMVKDISKDRLDEPKGIELVKALYVLEYYLNL
jgi:hypothetical protein